jgi:hypothetical protein
MEEIVSRHGPAEGLCFQASIIKWGYSRNTFTPAINKTSWTWSRPTVMQAAGLPAGHQLHPIDGGGSEKLYQLPAGARKSNRNLFNVVASWSANLRSGQWSRPVINHITIFNFGNDDRQPYLKTKHKTTADVKFGYLQIMNSNPCTSFIS